MTAVTSSQGLPPGPRLPYLLQTLLVWQLTGPFLRWCRRRFGSTFTVRAFPTKASVYVSRPADIKAVFAAGADVLHAGEANEILGPVLGERSVLLADEDEHLRRRRLMLPFFHGDSVRRYGEVITEIVDAEVATWPAGEPFRVHKRTQAITLEVILRAVIGLEEGERLVQMRSALRRIVEFAPGVLLMWVWPRLGSVGIWRRQRRWQTEAEALLMQEIADRRAAPDLEQRTDVLSQLIAAEYEDGTGMDDDELHDQVMTMLLAGHETTATGLAWAFERLTHNPAVMAATRKAADEGDDAYLDAVVKETLRSRPVIPDVARVVVKPFVVDGIQPAARDHRNAVHLARPGQRSLRRPSELRPGALPRRERAVRVRVHPVRRRPPPVPRGAVRRVRDARRPPARPAARRARGRKPSLGVVAAAAHHAGPGARGAGDRPAGRALVVLSTGTITYNVGPTTGAPLAIRVFTVRAAPSSLTSPRAIAGLRQSLGIGTLVALGKTAALFGYPARQQTAMTRLIGRWFGIREIVLAVLAPLGHGGATPIPSRQREIGAREREFAKLNAVNDAVDAAAMAVPLLKRRALPGGSYWGHLSRWPSRQDGPGFSAVRPVGNSRHLLCAVSSPLRQRLRGREEGECDLGALGSGSLAGIPAIREAALALGEGNPFGHHITNVRAPTAFERAMDNPARSSGRCSESPWSPSRGFAERCCSGRPLLRVQFRRPPRPPSMLAGRTTEPSSRS